MIQATELRIGNWVNIPECGINAVIDIIGAKKVCIDTTRVDLDDNAGCFMCESLNPIPLTPEILEKAGMKGDEILFDGSLRCIEMIKGNDAFIVHYIKKNQPNVKHLHQFQNLYFALTGTELDIKL